MLLAAAPAQAAGYRYWSFWEGGGKSGGWAYATQGPATARPADGDVVGFRFAVSNDSADASKPSAAPDFGVVCEGVAKKDGSKRVAVVIDFGGPEDAPPGETPPAKTLKVGCPEIREDATAAEALAAVAKPLRYDTNAMLCGIAGYPAKGCGEQVESTGTSGTSGTSGTPASKPAASAPAAAPAPAHSGGPSFGLVAGGAAVLLLGVAGVWQARRRRG
ncbi:SCO2322 family protein [Streptomyces sp. NPDC094032]|uniref:SCO2322 family protein n=1 Tax=Streptomyces sp. NPDC094032 TaxID=3155308 RepID=UPI00331663AE